MAEHSNSLKISCNWRITNEKKIKNAVTLIDSSKIVDIDEIVTLDSCIALSRQDEADQLEVSVELTDPKISIKSVWIVSEAKVLELFGRLGEYESTTNAVNTDDCDDEDEMQVYRAKLAPKTSTRKCSIRFAGAARRNEMWILGMGIVVEPCSVLNESVSMAERVENILLDSKVPLTKNAESFKEIVMSQPSFQSNVYCPGGEATLNADKMYLMQVEEKITQYIDAKFAHLEEKIDKKFDEILKILQK
ncbi:uncharacterized protein LOC135942053 [Cloeon dipterum]|uniref:uncharacterized protein LOC135942053 n=1 Tax=Cloeon dipterum TaxID=197152 RepID=UPI00321F83B9